MSWRAVIFALIVAVVTVTAWPADPVEPPTTRPFTWYRAISSLPPEQRIPRDDDGFLAEAYPPDDLEWTDEPAHSHELLLKTPLFEGRYVGAGANRSRGSTAFQTILKHLAAAGCLQDLVERAHLAGQLYGLC